MTPINHSKAPRGLKWRSNTFFILSTITIGMFTDLFLYGLVVPVIPFILKDRLDVPHTDIQKYTSLLLACFAGAQVLFSVPVGIIADKLPTRQLPFLVGLSALLLGTTLLYVGQSIEILVLARILQGMSAAVVWTIGLAMVLDTVGSKKLGVTIGSIFSIISTAELVAPVIGGIVYKKTGSVGVYAIGVVLLVIDFVMRLAVIEKKVAATYGLVEEDGESDGEASEDSPLLSNGNTEQEELEQWKIPKDQPAWILRHPILYCLGNKRFLVGQLVAFVQATLLAVFDATIPTHAQDLFGFDSLKAGLLFMPLVVPSLLFGPLFGKGVDKYGARIVATIGLAYLMLPLILLRIPHQGGGDEIAKFVVFITLSGIGLTFISSPSIVETSYVIEQYHQANKDFFGEAGPYAQLYAISSMVFSAGLAFGPLIAGGLRDRLGYGNMNAVVAGMCGIVSCLSFLYLGRIPKVVNR